MITRRMFLALPALSSIQRLAANERSDEDHFRHDHILGTSLDLVVWGATPEDARRADRAILDEVSRLSAILNTRDPDSEISRLERFGTSASSVELARVFALYASWEKRTAGVLCLRPGGPGTPVNVDALGKAYIIDRAVAVARRTAPSIGGVLLNIGGDIAAWGAPVEILVADPERPHDNAPPVTRVLIHNAAVATSGTSSRGAHLIDGRTQRAMSDVSATVVASDVVTANALATTLCVTEEREGFPIVEGTRGAEALRIGRGGVQQRTTGFALFERPHAAATVLQAGNWPTGYQMTITFVLPNLGARAFRPFVAVWVEDESGKLVKIITLWGLKSEWYKELTTFWAMTKGDRDLLFPVTRPTRSPGRYQLLWDGRDMQGKPAPLGRYRIVFEVNRERGTYTKRVTRIACGSEPASATVEPTENWDSLSIQYGPKPAQA